MHRCCDCPLESRHASVSVWSGGSLNVLINSRWPRIPSSCCTSMDRSSSTNEEHSFGNHWRKNCSGHPVDNWHTIVNDISITACDQWHVQCPLNSSLWQRHSNQYFAVREAATICPRPCDLNLWPFDLENGVRVTCDVGYLCANFSLPRPLCSRLRPNVRDRQRDRQTSDSIIA